MSLEIGSGKLFIETHSRLHSKSIFEGQGRTCTRRINSALTEKYNKSTSTLQIYSITWHSQQYWQLEFLNNHLYCHSLQFTGKRRVLQTSLHQRIIIKTEYIKYIFQNLCDNQQVFNFLFKFSSITVFNIRFL